MATRKRRNTGPGAALLDAADDRIAEADERIRQIDERLGMPPSTPPLFAEMDEKLGLPTGLMGAIMGGLAATVGASVLMKSASPAARKALNLPPAPVPHASAPPPGDVGIRACLKCFRLGVGCTCELPSLASSARVSIALVEISTTLERVTLTRIPYTEGERTEVARALGALIRKHLPELAEAADILEAYKS